MKSQVSAQDVHLIKNENEALCINWSAIKLSDFFFFCFFEVCFILKQHDP